MAKDYNGINIPTELIEWLDAIVKYDKFRSRAEAVKDYIRNRIKEINRMDATFRQIENQSQYTKDVDSGEKTLLKTLPKIIITVPDDIEFDMPYARKVAINNIA